ncbi:single-stranded-DNA-specific exonuclease RecJ [Granulicella sp. 5B5]|uniref:single-stranded-DNA-specific exonuclease RecJ n=1 Tax=Granulicella sp. 5B5 TaxID=1617967 RepID=UPI0015F40ACF|nr:single-stranded-DNA-specific exonuclease RecJ [Granulicella sp. 5B5]QMV20101.1 single-stranded-DNA-specific exonuclease RecJ [Granulicella sp. 5B5]
MNDLSGEDPWVVVGRGSGDASLLVRELGVPEGIARILVGRGFGTVEAARAFLEPSMGQLHDPLLMLGMREAVVRLRAALVGGEPVLIYGDYDVDGTVATVLLKTALERAAVQLGTTADVRYHIPHRVREGYGMQDQRIADAATEGVRLVVSVDTGIRAFAAAEEAKRVGLDLIVTDHHLPDGMQGVPEAIAVVNPNQPGCGYPYKVLCGAGVAFKLAQALLEDVTPEAERAKLREKLLPSFLKLLAVATIADSVALTGENRAIAAIGLQELRKPAQAGLRALLELAQIDTTRPIAAGDVGFRLAPRINAAGRMDIASDVVELFLTRDGELARTLAEKLHRLNDERRAAEAEALRAIEAQIEAMQSEDGEVPGCLVLDDGEDRGHAWHRGVIGILASRVVDRTGKPALVITHEDGVAYGSGRSVAGFHLLDALTAAHAAKEGDRLLTRFGGHAHAVGFALPSESVGELRVRMAQYADDMGIEESDATAVEYDSEVRLGEITPAFWETLERLGPYGMENPEPLFVARGVRIEREPRSVQERHLRVMLEDAEDGAKLGGMAWARRVNWADRAQEEGWMQGAMVDVAFRLRENRHPDFGGIEMEIVALRGARGGDEVSR